MALTKCEECGGQLSDRAMTCPHCGAAARARASVKIAAGLTALLAGLLVAAITAVRGASGASPERIAAPMLVAGLIAALAVVMGIVALVRATRR